MKTYQDCWVEVASSLFSQALAGEPKLADSFPRPLPGGSFAYAATLSGDVRGRFAVILDKGLLEAPLMGEGVDQKSGWGELLRETLEAACGELLAATAKKCRVERFEETDGESRISRAFELKSGDRSWTILVHDQVRDAAAAPSPEEAKRTPASASSAAPSSFSPGLELLLDVELEASLRFGSCEMPLGEILNLGPGDVVQLDRHVADPVDLIVGDKIVASGEVVLVNGNFGLRVTAVAEPRKRLESIRCLF
jgi:flagellar motor switch protein FliN